jgi:hypothetical protein
MRQLMADIERRSSGSDPMAWRAAHPGFVRLAWLVLLAFALQEAEEWNTLGYQTYFPGGPAMSAVHVRVTMVVAVLIGWLWTLAALRARSAQGAAFALLPFAAALFLEALQHAYAVARVRDYVPGMVMSLTVLGPASLLLARRAWHDGLVSRSYVISLAAIVLLAFGVWAMRPEVNLTNKMVVADRMGAALAHLVGY